MKLLLAVGLPFAITASGVMPVSSVTMAQGRSERLSAPLDFQQFTGDVDSFRVAPDGRWVVYRAQQDDPVAGLYATRADLSTSPLLISGPGVAVGEFQLSPDGTRVVYQSPQGLIKVGPNGVRVQLNPPLVGGGSIYSFKISPDGRRVVYLADQDTDNVFQVYSVPINGATSPVPLSQSPPPDSFLIVPDSTRVVFFGLGGLFSVPIDGSSPPLALCGSFVPGGGVSHPIFADDPNSYYRISPDGRRVVYMADQLVDEQVELFSVPIDQSQGPVRLNLGPVVGGDVQAFRISADSRWVVYLADQDVNDVVELFAVPLDGSAPSRQLSLTERPSSFIGDFALSPSGTRVAYSAHPIGSFGEQLFSVPVDGSLAPLQLSDLPSNFGDIFAFSFAPDSSRIVYRANRNEATTEELFSVPVDGSAGPVRLNLPPFVQGDVTTFRFTPAGDEVVYRGEHTQRGVFELFRVPLDGSAAPVLLGSPGRTVEADFALAGSSACFRCELAIDRVLELCAVPLDASEPPMRLNGPLLSEPAVSDVTSFALSPDGNWAAYCTGTGAFSVPLALPGMVRALTPSGRRSGCTRMGISSHSTRAFFTGASAVAQALFSAPIDGGSAALQLASLGYGGGYLEAPDGSRLAYTVGSYAGPSGLNTVPPDGSAGAFIGQVSRDFFFTPDGTRLVFGEPRDFVESGGPVRLLMRAADGSSLPVDLVPNTPTGDETIASYRMTADGTRVVFTCDLDRLSKIELYSVPSDGSLLPTKLSGPLADDRDVTGFYLTPDGQHAVYAADRDAPGAFELYVAPIDGSSAPLELSGQMVTGGDVALATIGLTRPPLIQITPDSSLVVFVADKEVDERYELYSVPIDASRPPLKLNPPLVANGDVRLDPTGVRLSRDGTRVVYLADQSMDERVELYSVPIGGGPVVALSGRLGANRDVQPGFVVLQHSDAVLFRADLARDEEIELWLAPLDGRAPPTRRCALTHPAADVEADFALAPDESFVYYRADALADERMEFFRFPLERTPRHERR